MDRSPTLLVALGLALLLLWTIAAGWSCGPARHPPPAADTEKVGSTAIIRQPVAAHVVQNRDIHDMSITTDGGLRGIFVPRGGLADIRRSKACACTRPFCPHPRGRAVQGHEEFMLTSDQQKRYFRPEDGWECTDMNYPSFVE